MATPTTLAEYYSGLNKPLPSIQERGQTYQSLGLGSSSTYTGSAEQNTALLQKLTNQTLAPSATTQPPIAPPPVNVSPTATSTSPTPTPAPTSSINAPDIQKQIDTIKQKAGAIQTALQGMTPEQLGSPAATGSVISDVSNQIDNATKPVSPDLQTVITNGLQSLQNLSDQYAQSIANQPTLLDTYNQLATDQGLPAIKSELVNLQNIMLGTKNDIRAELTAAGVPITDSGVAYLADLRDQKLVIQAQQLQNLVTQKEDYIDKIVTLTGEDRKAVADRINTQLDIQNKQLTLAADLAKTQATQSLAYARFLQSSGNQQASKIISMANNGALAGASNERLQQLADQTNGIFTFSDLQDLRSASANKDPLGLFGGLTTGINNQLYTPSAVYNQTGTPSATDNRNYSYLNSLPDSIRNTVQNIADYKLDVTKVTSLRNADRTKLVNMVTQFDPSFDMTQYTSRSALRKDFTSGKSSQNIRSLNTAIGHIQTLDNAFKQLGNTSIPFLNVAKNAFAKQTGQGPIVGAIQTLNAVSSELASIFKNAGATDQEISAWKNSLDINASPEQLKNFVNTGIELMGSRLQALSGQWEAGMGQPKDFRFIYPQQLQTLQNVINDTGANIDINSLDPLASQNPPTYDSGYHVGSVIESGGKQYKIINPAGDLQLVQ